MPVPQAGGKFLFSYIHSINVYEGYSLKNENKKTPLNGTKPQQRDENLNLTYQDTGF